MISAAKELHGTFDSILLVGGEKFGLLLFDEKGNFNVETFLKQLDRVVKKDEPFALICRVGSRTSIVSEFLSERLGYKVTNLKGGIMKMIHEGYKTVPYQP